MIASIHATSPNKMVLDKRLLDPSRNDFRFLNPSTTVEGALSVGAARPLTFCQKMTLLRFVLLWLGACASCLAQGDFRFLVSDYVKDDRLNYEFLQDVTVYDWDSDDPRLSYIAEYRISGINQKEFSFTNERFESSIPRKEYAGLMEKARKLPIKELKIAGELSAYGWITIDGEDHQLSASVDTEARKLWKAFIDDLLTKYAPSERRKKSKRTLQGEAVEPVSVSFPELLKNPEVFDGKRIRITGFYHGEFEGSSFASTAKDIHKYDKALWLGGASTYADPKKVSRPNDALLTIDGTFEVGPGGHMGLWMGELSRVTAIKQAEQAGSGQPATRPESKPKGNDKPQPEAEGRSR